MKWNRVETCQCCHHRNIDAWRSVGSPPAAGVSGVPGLPLVRPAAADTFRRAARMEPDAEENQEKQREIRMEAVEFLKNYNTRIENLEYDVSVIRNNLAVLDDRIYALREKVDHTPTTEQSQTPKPKRTNKDVLLAAFPRMVMDGDVPVLCPRTMDRDIYIQHCAVRSCDQCRHEYWLSEVEK